MGTTVAVLMGRNRGDRLWRARRIHGLGCSHAERELVFVNERAVERAPYVRRQQQVADLPNVAKEGNHRQGNDDCTPCAPCARLASDSTAKRLHGDGHYFSCTVGWPST